MQLYYRDAISVEVMQAEQQRIAAEQAQVERWQSQAVAQVDDVMQALDDALTLLCKPGTAYEQADASLRKLLNRAIFSRILIQVVDRRIEIDGVPHEVFTALVQTAKSLGMAPERPPDILLEAHGPSWPDPVGRPAAGPQRTNPNPFSRGRGSHVDKMAERAGFEPAMGVEPHTRLAGECLQPLGHLSLRLSPGSVEPLVRIRRRLAGLRCDRGALGSATPCCTARVPTRHPRQMVTLTPDRAALLDKVAAVEGRRPDLGHLVEEGARARLERHMANAAPTRAARRRLADRVREGAVDQDRDAADRVKRLGLDED